MFEYFGGVTLRIVCDNLKTGVVTHPREGDIVLNQCYEDFSNHYCTAIMPAGVKKPKQKASVEGTVGKIATAIIARLRKNEYTSIHDLKMDIAAALEDFNNKPFQKREGSRRDVFEANERITLRPLPAFPYEYAVWEYGRVIGSDFHVSYQTCKYSVPYRFVGKTVDLKITDSMIEIYCGHERISSHKRFPSYARNKYDTYPEDIPERFQKKEWNELTIRQWAASIGKQTLTVVDRIFKSYSTSEQGINPSMSVLKLSKKYSYERLETACELALEYVSVPRYSHLKAILAASQDVEYREAGILGTNLLDSEEFRKLRSQACATLARLRVGMRDQAVLVETLSADAAQIEDATAEIRSVMRSLGVKTMREAEMLGASMRTEKGVEDVRERLGLEPDEVKEAVGRIGVLAETVRSAIYRYGEHEDEIRADAKVAAEAWAAVRDDREKVARANIRLAFQEAAGYADRGIAVADLTSVANEALAVAIDDYDAGRDGASFETFVRGRVRKALVDTVAGGELDTGARKRVAKLNNALRMLMQKDGKEPSDAQLAARLGWDEGRVRSVRREAMRARMSRTVSMDQAIGGEEDGATLMDFIADKSAQREEEARLVDKGGMLPELKDRNRELEKKGTLLKDRLLSPEEIGLDGGAAARRIRDAVKRQREIHDGLGER